MDAIQRQLSSSTINNFYSTAEFELDFQPSAVPVGPMTGFTYPSEQHCTYEELRSAVFTAWVAYSDPHKTPRQLIIQPVPRDFRSSLFRPPVAVWRGIGTELRDGGGGPAAALALVSFCVQHAAAEPKRQDPNPDWQYYSFLSFHKVTVKPPPKPPQLLKHRPRNRERSRTRAGQSTRPSTEPAPSTPAGPVQAQLLGNIYSYGLLGTRQRP